MSDYDRDREPVRETHRTTVVDTGGGRGGGGAIALILLLIVVAGIAWFLMRSGSRSASQVGVNVSVPTVKAPNINVKVPDKIDVKVPDVNIRTDKSSANSSH